MAFNALRDDLFGILEAFASPRQGPRDNVALLAQEQQEQAAPPPPPPGPLPFQPPQPTRSRVVPPGDDAVNFVSLPGQTAGMRALPPNMGMGKAKDLAGDRAADPPIWAPATPQAADAVFADNPPPTQNWPRAPASDPTRTPAGMRSPPTPGPGSGLQTPGGLSLPPPEARGPLPPELTEDRNPLADLLLPFMRAGLPPELTNARNPLEDIAPPGERAPLPPELTNARNPLEDITPPGERAPLSPEWADARNPLEDFPRPDARAPLSPELADARNPLKDFPRPDAPGPLPPELLPFTGKPPQTPDQAPKAPDQQTAPRAPGQPQAPAAPPTPSATRSYPEGPSGAGGGGLRGEPAQLTPQPTGGFDAFSVWQQMQAKAAADAAKAEAMQSAMAGFQLMMAGMTRSPSEREMLASASRATGSGSGSGSGAGKGAPGLGDLNKYGENLTAAQEKAWILKNAPAIAKEYGVSATGIALMSDKDRSEFLKERALGKDLDLREDASGAVHVYSKSSGREEQIRGPDAFKVEQHQRAGQKLDLERQGEERLQAGERRTQQTYQQREDLVGRLAMRTGMTMDQARATVNNNPEHATKIVTGDFDYWVEPSTGTRYMRDKNDVNAKPIVVQESPDVGKRYKADLQKVEGENTEQKFKLAQDALVRGNYDVAAEVLDKPVTDLQLMGPERVRELLSQKHKTFEPTADIKEYREENENRKRLNEADRPPFQTLGDFQAYKNRLKENEERIRAGLPVAAGARKEVMAKAAESSGAIREGYSTRATELALLDTGQLIEGSPWSETMLTARKALAAATGRKDDAVTQTEVRGVLAARDALTLGAEMKGALSDKDREFLVAMAAGNKTLDPEATRQILSIQNMLQRKKLLANNATIERLNANTEKAERVYETAEVYDVDPNMRRYTDNQSVTKMLKDPRGFDAQYGKGTAQDFKDNFDAVVAAKMQERGVTPNGSKSNVYNTPDTGNIERTRKWSAEAYEKLRPELDKQYKMKFGAQGEGLFDMILEAKKRGLFLPEAAQ